MGSTRFDQLSMQVAAATSRRQALRLLAGSLIGGLVVGTARPAEAKQRCRRVGEKCDEGKACCVGVCCGEVCCAEGQVCQAGVCVTPPPPVLARQICVCVDGTVLNICADLDCASSAAQDAICGPACAPHGGESATGCIDADPACAAA